MTFAEAEENFRKALRGLVVEILRGLFGQRLLSEAAQLPVESDELLAVLKALADRCEADTRFMFDEAAYGVDREKGPTMPEEALAARALIDRLEKPEG